MAVTDVTVSPGQEQMAEEQLLKWKSGNLQANHPVRWELSGMTGDMVNLTAREDALPFQSTKQY